MPAPGYTLALAQFGDKFLDRISYIFHGAVWHDLLHTKPPEQGQAFAIPLLGLKGIDGHGLQRDSTRSLEFIINSPWFRAAVQRE